MHTSLSFSSVVVDVDDGGGAGLGAALVAGVALVLVVGVAFSAAAFTGSTGFLMISGIL